MPVEQDDARLDSLQGTAAKETIQLGADFLTYARKRYSPIEFKTQLVERLLPTVPLKGKPFVAKPREPFGKFEIRGRLGKGGMAEVYMALDPERASSGSAGQAKERECMVALKVMKPEIALEPEYVKRFLREAANAALIEHRNVVRVFEVGSIQGRLYYTMELIEGETLKEVLERGQLPEDHGVQVLIQMVDGLRAAHERGIGHRDLKPANVMLVTAKSRWGVELAGEFDVAVKITDFGLAHMMQADTTEKQEEGRFLGTAKYVAPEVVKGESPTLKSDVFSLGILAFQMLSGRPPFQARNKLEYIAANLQMQAPALDSVAKVHPGLSRLVGSMLEKDPAARPDVATLSRELRQVLSESGSGSGSGLLPPDDEPRPAAAEPRRGTGVLVAAAGAAVVAVGLGVWWVSSGPPPPPPPPKPVRPADPTPPRTAGTAVKPPVPPPPVDVPEDPPGPAGLPPLAAQPASNLISTAARTAYPEHIQAGERAWSRGDWAEARERWTKALSLLRGRDPALLRRIDLTEIRIALAESHAAEARGETKAALAAAERANARGELPPEERARLERLRELKAGPGPEQQPTPPPEEPPAPPKAPEPPRDPARAEELLAMAEASLDQRGLSSAESALRDAEAAGGKTPRWEQVSARLRRLQACPPGFEWFESPDRTAAIYARARLVTNAEYQRWFQAELAGGALLLSPEGWKGQQSAPAGEEDRPVLGVRLAQAEKYAASLKERLPTPAELALLRARFEREKGGQVETIARAQQLPHGFWTVRQAP